MNSGTWLRKNNKFFQTLMACLQLFCPVENMLVPYVAYARKKISFIPQETKAAAVLPLRHAVTYSRHDFYCDQFLDGYLEYWLYRCI